MKINTIRKKANSAALGQRLGPYEIDLRDVQMDPTMQARNKLDEGNKSRLRSAYRAGAEVPPLLVAFIEGGGEWPVIIDGHHRFNVLETLRAEGFRIGNNPLTTVRAEVVRLTREEARHQAAMANSKHGLPLKPKEGRRVFGAYVRAGHHKEVDGTFKSYREIGRDMSRDHKTVILWMKADFPKEAAEIKEPEKATAGREGPPPVPPVLRKHVIEAELLDLRNLFEESYSGDRVDLVAGLESLLSDFRATLAQTPYWEHDEAMDRARQQQPSPGANEDF